MIAFPALWSPNLKQKPRYEWLDDIDRRHPLVTKRLISYWLMGEGAGNKAFDFVDVRSHATVQSGATWAKSGRYGAALALDGSTGHLTVTQNGRYALSSGPFTIAVLVKDDTAYASLTTYHRILSWHDGSKNIQFGLGQGASSPNRMFYLINSNTNGAPQIISGGDCGTGYHMVIVAFDGTNYTMWIDGVSTSGGTSGAGSVTVYNTESTTLYIGQRGNGAYMLGNVDLVAIWGAAFTEADAKAFTANPLALLTVGRVWIQPAAAGSQQTLAGSAAGVGSIAAAVNITRAVAASSAGAGSISAAVNAQRGVDATISCGSSTTAGVNATRAVSAASAGVGSTSAVVSANRGLAAAVAGTSSTAGAIVRLLGIAAASAGSAAVSGTLSVGQVILAGASAGIAAVAGAINLLKGLAGSPSGSASTTGSVSATRSLSAESQGSATTSSTSVITRLISAVSSGIASIVAALTKTSGAQTVYAARATFTDADPVATMTNGDPVAQLTEGGAIATITEVTP